MGQGKEGGLRGGARGGGLASDLIELTIRNGLCVLVDLKLLNYSVVRLCVHRAG